MTPHTCGNVGEYDYCRACAQERVLIAIAEDRVQKLRESEAPEVPNVAGPIELKGHVTQAANFESLRRVVNIQAVRGIVIESCWQVVPHEHRPGIVALMMESGHSLWLFTAFEATEGNDCVGAVEAVSQIASPNGLSFAVEFASGGRFVTSAYSAPILEQGWRLAVGLPLQQTLGESPKEAAWVPIGNATSGL